jgi:hypothetical protein
MKLKIIVTFSKFFAVIVLVLGSLYSFKHSETSVIVIAISTSTAIVMGKQWQDRLKSKDTINAQSE